MGVKIEHEDWKSGAEVRQNGSEPPGSPARFHLPLEVTLFQNLFTPTQSRITTAIRSQCRPVGEFGPRPHGDCGSRSRVVPAGRTHGHEDSRPSPGVRGGGRTRRVAAGCSKSDP